MRCLLFALVFSGRIGQPSLTDYSVVLARRWGGRAGSSVGEALAGAGFQAAVLCPAMLRRRSGFGVILPPARGAPTHGLEPCWCSVSAEEKAEPPQAMNALMRLNQLKPGLQYKLVSQTGPVHAPIFTMSVEVDGNSFEASGPSKKTAKLHVAVKVSMGGVRHCVLVHRAAKCLCIRAWVEQSWAIETLSVDNTGLREGV